MSIEQATRTITVEQFQEMPNISGMQTELVRGEVVEMPPPFVPHNMIVFSLSRLLDTFVSEQDLGLIHGDNTGYLLSRYPDTVRVPDVSFVSWERMPEEGVPDRYWSLAPDIAVEVVSSTDRADNVHDKVNEYLAAGTRLVWVLWPTSRTMSVYEIGGVARELGPDDVLDGGDVLPGFAVRVTELFNVRRKR